MKILKIVFLIRKMEYLYCVTRRDCTDNNPKKHHIMYCKDYETLQDAEENWKTHIDENVDTIISTLFEGCHDQGVIPESRHCHKIYYYINKVKLMYP